MSPLTYTHPLTITLSPSRSGGIAGLSHAGRQSLWDPTLIHKNTELLADGPEIDIQPGRFSHRDMTYVRSCRAAACCQAVSSTASHGSFAAAVGFVR